MTDAGDHGRRSSAAEASASRPANNAVTPSSSPIGCWARTPRRPHRSRRTWIRDLCWTVEVARNLVGAHQAAAALIVSGDWTDTRKWFSLSSKYARWFDYRTPAVGLGLHALVVADNRVLRLTQAEVEANPAWREFSG